MSLNDTLDRLAREREQKETARQENETNEQVRDYAERIFFSRMLKDINPGLSEPKIEAMIDRSILIARMLADKLNKQ